MSQPNVPVGPRADAVAPPNPNPAPAEAPAEAGDDAEVTAGPVVERGETGNVPQLAFLLRYFHR